ncbi:N-acetylglucosamine kinase, partial [Pseudomonas sp. BGM005]|nr:N-acetylglucosamine kinase [Pseudomonas sp. BG5]
DLMERSLLAHDGVRPASAITEALMAEYGSDPERVVEFAHSARPTDFARYAPVVFDHAAKGDTVAVGIITDAATAIGESLDALLWPECPSICLLGGLAGAYEPWLSERYRSRLASPKGDALQGAVELAVKLLNGRQRGTA